MTEEKTLGQIEWEARMGVYQAAGYTPTDFSYHWDSLSDNQKAAQEAGASAVREKVRRETIEECIELVTRERAFFDRHGKDAADTIYRRLEGLAATSGERTEFPQDQRLLETNLIHPHPRQDGQQCDHPGAEEAQ